MIRLFFLMLSWGLLSSSLYAQGHDHGHDHGDHGHSHGELDNIKAEKTAWETLTVSSNKYELLLKYLEIVPKDSATFKLYVADYKTNRPLLLPNLKIQCKELPQLDIKHQMPDTGIYEFKIYFEKEGHYSFNVNLGDEQLVLKELHVHEKSDAHADEHEHHHHWYTSIPFIFSMGMLLGLLLMFLFFRKPRGRAMTLLLVFVGSPIAWQPSPVWAQHDHDHGPTQNSEKTTVGNRFHIAKETQFLFGIRTQVAAQGVFTPATPFFGHIVPAANAVAELQAPYAGSIRQLLVRPGLQVQAGQLLAVLEQNIGASEQVGISSQVANLELELEKAKKRLTAAEIEWKRLEPIKDVVAAKDWQLAVAQLETAKVELARLQAATQKELPNAQNKMVYLRAPIKGTIGDLHISLGNFVNAGQPLLSIENADQLMVEVQVSENDIHNIGPNGKFEICSVSNNEKKKEAVFVNFMPSVNRFNQTQRILLAFENKDGLFKMGEFVTVFASQKKEQQSEILLPYSALSLLEGLPVVFTKIGPEEFEMRFVNADERNAAWVSASKGLSIEERVVVLGTYQVKMAYMNRS